MYEEPTSGSNPSSSEAVCSNGYPGVESIGGDVCCEATCSECGGTWCVGYEDCCEEKIHDSGVLCTDEGVEAGPCILIEGALSYGVNETINWP